MTFRQTFAATWRDSVAFLVACPLLALLPVGFELIQHVAEVHVGMYDGVAAARAVQHHPLRMGFGFAKVMMLVIQTYWVTRYLAWRDPALAARADPVALRCFAGLLAFNAAVAAIQLFVLPQSGPVLLATLLGGQVIGALIAAWAAAAPLGNAAIGPRASAAIMVRQLPWTWLFLFAAMLPLMIPHYALGALAILGPKPILWPVLVVDALLVSWLGTVIAASCFHAALRAATRAGVALVPPAPDRATAGRLTRP